jgi:hypothetical protein
MAVQKSSTELVILLQMALNLVRTVADFLLAELAFAPAG